jgi:hypothetical protein
MEILLVDPSIPDGGKNNKWEIYYFPLIAPQRSVEW